MDKTYWEKAQELFHEALALSDQERAGFLDGACADDPACLAEVRLMLQCDDEGSRLLDDGGATLAALASRTIGAPRGCIVAREIGPYKLLRILGEGGMGVVWLASRKDTDTPVALKFLPHSSLSPSRRQRFAREIKTLAKLRHPHIARLYDAGSLVDGTPWFVMEYVQGSPLTEYCEQNALPFEARLQLFHLVCEAVQFAHGQEIIHRDLKPSNILVEADSTPRLLDFGIARELQSLEEASELTRPGLRFVSPHYAAPEWIRHGTVGLYTDVYSLGVILYQMLTGKLPFDPDQSELPIDPCATAHLLSKKPSLSANPQLRVSRSAWKEIDVICLTAMHGDWRKRYRSVEALLRDLDHLKRDEPLEARPDRAGYRFAKFVFRNLRPLIAVAALVMLVLGLTIFFSVRLERTRLAAVAEASRIQTIQRFMLDLFGGAEDSAAPKSNLLAVTLLDRGSKQAESLQSDPETQVRLYQLLGRMYSMLGEPAKSIDLLGRALTIERDRPGSDANQRVDLLVMRGIVLTDSAQYKQAEQSIREAIAVSRRNLPLDDPETVYAYAALGKLMSANGSYRDAVAILQPIVQVKPHNKDEQETLRESLSCLGIAEYSLGEYENAIATDRRGLTLARKMFGEAHPRIAESLVNLGQAEGALFELDSAESDTRRALKIVSDWYGPEHPDAALATIQLARILSAEGRDDEAYPMLKKAVAIEEQAYGDKDVQAAVGLDLLGRIEASRGRLAAAKADLNRSIAALTDLYGLNNYVTAVSNADLGDIYTRQGEPTRGEKLLRVSVNVLQEHFREGDFHLTLALAMWGHSLLASKNYLQAEQELTAAVKSTGMRPNLPPLQMKRVSDDLTLLQKRWPHSHPTSDSDVPPDLQPLSHL